MATELVLLSWIVAFGFVHLAIVAALTVRRNGVAWGLSSRETPPAPLTGAAGRTERAFRNFLETFPFAAAAILVAVVSARLNAWTLWGANLYVWGRVAFVPIYAADLVPWRTVAAAISFLGIALVLVGIAVGR